MLPSVKFSPSSNKIRAKINDIDERLLTLLQERLRAAREIGAAKSAETGKYTA